MAEPLGAMVALAGDRSPGSGDRGYLVSPDVGTGPGLVVLPGHVGLTEPITGLCDRLAAEGFVVLAAAPGAATAAAVSVSGHPSVRGDGLGVLAFANASAVALALAIQPHSKIEACVLFDVPPSSSLLERQRDGALPVALELHVAVGGDREGDGEQSETACAVAVAEAAVREAGPDLAVHRYDGAQPGFFCEGRTDEHDAEAAALAWTRTLSFLRAHLG